MRKCHKRVETRTPEFGDRLVVRYEDPLRNQRAVPHVEVVGVYQRDGADVFKGMAEVRPDVDMPPDERERAADALRQMKQFARALIVFDPQEIGMAMQPQRERSYFYPAEKSA